MVKASREKYEVNYLAHEGYKCFLPVGKFARRWSDRTKISEAPLFQGYFFCRMDPYNRLPVLMTPGVIQIVSIGKIPSPIQEEEIIALQHLMESELPTMPWPYLKVGDVARIEQGPLRGL